MHEKRTYRNHVRHKDLVKFTVTVKETDLQIQATGNLFKESKDAVTRHRKTIEKYISKHPVFKDTLKPLPDDNRAPSIIREMLTASAKAGVGPMAAVAGVMSEYVAKDLLKYSRQIIIENGGDISLKTEKAVNIGIFAGDSPLSMRIGVKIQPSPHLISVCTSSGTIGHSLSFGSSDAACVIADSAALADAAATSIGNHVKSGDDISSALSFGRTIPDIRGIVIVKHDKAGFWGDIEIVKL